eukprot:scaffold4091_cov85-Skeletonema_dohrnii-CCMP3373.AAC.5
MGTTRYHEEDYEAATDYWTKAAVFGNAMAHSGLYAEGEVIEKDKTKELYHLEEADMVAIRYTLALEEGKDGRFERAVNNFSLSHSWR